MGPRYTSVEGYDLTNKKRANSICLLLGNFRQSSLHHSFVVSPLDIVSRNVLLFPDADESSIPLNSIRSMILSAQYRVVPIDCIEADRYQD